MPGRADYRIELVAKAAGVTERTARRWKDKGDPRWAKHIKRDEAEVEKTFRTWAPQFFDKPAAGELEEEGKRLGALARELAAKIDLEKPETRSDLIADYTRVVDSMRKLRSERPGIEEAEGSMVPVGEADKIVAARDAALIPLLRGMPGRLAAVCANRPAAEVQEEIEREVGSIMRAVEAAF